MGTGLDRTIREIDPEITFNRNSRAVNKALKSFPAIPSKVDNWEDYKTLLSNVYRHIENTVLSVNLPMESYEDMDWGRCCEILQKRYGYSAEKAAFEVARTGNEGGIYAVLKAIAELMAEEYTSNEVSARINNFWNSLSTDEKLAVSLEYLDKYSQLLPPELTEKSAARVRANFPKVLEEHHHALRRFREIGRG